MELQEWLDTNSLLGEIVSQCFLVIDDQTYFILKEKEIESYTDSGSVRKTTAVFDQELQFVLTEQEIDILVEHQVDKVVFQFGEKWYHSRIETPALNVLKYMGSSKSDGADLPYLGIHGKYDICNGSRDYKDWCKKAQFMGVTTLGICEHNTLAGTLVFQVACQESKIKSVIGETITVRDKESAYKVKLYCLNETGWRNLLNINAQIKVFNDGFVDTSYVWEHSEGLVCVIDCSTRLSAALIKSYMLIFGDDLYYQFDPVEWSGSAKETEHLELLKEYVNKYTDQIRPVLVCDSYYLDKDESHVRKMLNKIGKVGFQNESQHQWFKSVGEVMSEITELFKDDKRADAFIDVLVGNTVDLASKCDFKIKVGELHLPQYEMTTEESSHFETNIDLFWSLIQKGIEEKIINKVKDEQIYLDRIQEEVRVIEKGGLVDYFLIIWDIINWCKRNNILTSIGRGSAAGSLISYLLGIVKIDPIVHGLLFERFFSEARINKGLPDIDNDVQSNRRDEVKRYIEQRYGVDYVTSIGTYGTFKMKASIKDLGKYFNVDFTKTNYITSFIPDDCDFTGIFKFATQSDVLKSFLQQHPQVIESYELLSHQPRTTSVHAAGVIIVPKTYNGVPMTIYDWLPVKKIDGVLVTEWEGEQLEEAGFLKADILGISQLEKFSEIIELIEINHNRIISFADMDLQDENVYRLFQEGSNEDVFQFGAVGLKNYCRDLKPFNIQELIATVALYRPGPMESGAHRDFIKLKNGEKEPEYDYMLEDVTRDTYGLYIFQESVMKAVHILGGLSLVEAEDVRKAMGKKLIDKMEKYRIQFIEGAVKNGCNQLDAIRIWNKLEVFSGYGFNKSHAAAYAHIGFFCQWLKHNFPIEFWTISLHYADQEEIAKRIAEMHKVSNVKVLPPDINNSIDRFKPDFQTNTIYWSISSIKQIGEKTMENLLLERNTNGEFFSFEEFYTRIKGKGVNKRAMINLILSGCFDKVEKLKSPSERLFVIKKLMNILSEEMPEGLSNSDSLSKDYFWILKQKELTGFGYFDFEKIYKTNSDIVNNKLYLDPSQLQTDQYVGKNVCVTGILSSFKEYQMKKKTGSLAQVVIDCNDEQVNCTIWSEIWPEYKDQISKGINKIILLTGEVKFDQGYRGINIIQTNDKTKITIL